MNWTFIMWVIVAVLGPFMFIRGIWSLFQPWGSVYQKLVALAFFLVMWLVAIYFIFEKKLKLTEREKEKRQHLLYLVISLTFVIGSIFIIVIKPQEAVTGISGILFFGLCGAVAFSKYRKMR